MRIVFWNMPTSSTHFLSNRGPFLLNLIVGAPSKYPSDARNSSAFCAVTSVHGDRWKNPCDIPFAT